MKRNPFGRYILAGKGLFLKDVAKAHNLHPNTVIKWCKRLNVEIGLMRTDGRRFRQAIRTGDVRRFIHKYREMGGEV